MYNISSGDSERASEREGGQSSFCVWCVYVYVYIRISTYVWEEEREGLFSSLYMKECEQAGGSEYRIYPHTDTHTHPCMYIYTYRGECAGWGIKACFGWNSRQRRLDEMRDEQCSRRNWSVGNYTERLMRRARVCICISVALGRFSLGWHRFDRACWFLFGISISIIYMYIALSRGPPPQKKKTKVLAIRLQADTRSLLAPL